jgi:hypothetical protein
MPNTPVTRLQRIRVCHRALDNGPTGGADVIGDVGPAGPPVWIEFVGEDGSRFRTDSLFRFTTVSEVANAVQVTLETGGVAVENVYLQCNAGGCVEIPDT